MFSLETIVYYAFNREIFCAFSKMKYFLNLLSKEEVKELRFWSQFYFSS